MSEKSKKTSTLDYFHGKLLEFDFLGAPVGFSMGGKKTHDTVIGALTSICILTIIAMYCVKLLIAKSILSENPILSDSIHKGYFSAGEGFTNFADGFDFAIAVASHETNIVESYEDTLRNLRIQAFTRLTNHTDFEMVDHKEEEIQLKPC